MRNFLLVGTGGFLGSVARFYLSAWLTRASGAARFPFGTLGVNVLGCLAIGILAGLAEQRDFFAPPTRHFLLTGILGGFTTYSAFAYETYFLGREQLWSATLASIGLHVVLGLGAVWLGHQIVAG